jgi:hypothetical protein
VSETDLFFISIKALRTLPVGRTLAETLELAASAEGTALRQRVKALHSELIAGGAPADILKRIENDAEAYRQLTARLRSPNLLSGVTDMVLSALGLIPVVGTYFSAASLTKSSFGTARSAATRRKIRDMYWASYQGRSI